MQMIKMQLNKENKQEAETFCFVLQFHSLEQPF